MSHFNPDYPTASMGFGIHTCQPQGVNNEMFYYNGGAINPFGNQPMGSSRRDMGYYPNQMGYGYQTQPAPVVPVEQKVMPFSSYPSGTPTQTAPAFNSLAESRRDVNPVATNNANPINPWAQQQVATPQCVPTPPVFSNPCMVTQYGFVGNGCAALYTGQSNFGFDKKSGCWDNMYTTPRPPMMPNVNWNAANVNPMGVYQQPAYPVAQYPETNVSWLEIAERNWGMGR